jgi:serine/threonine protein kinase
MIAKVGDFGIAGIKKTGVRGEDTNAGTAKFMSPELQTGDDIEANTAIDIWAIGIMLFMMVCGYHPFKTKDRAETVKNIIKAPVKFSDKVIVSDEWKDLIMQMLVKDPKARINMFKVENHRWFEMTDTEIFNAHDLNAKAQELRIALIEEKKKIWKRRSISSIIQESIRKGTSSLGNSSLRLQSLSMIKDVNMSPINEEQDQAKKQAYERFNEKVFMLNSAQKPPLKKKLDVIKLIK